MGRDSSFKSSPSKSSSIKPLPKKNSEIYEQPAPPPKKSMWSVELQISPEGPMTFKVRAGNENEAIALAVAAAYKHPAVDHVLDVEKPVKLGRGED